VIANYEATSQAIRSAVKNLTKRNGLEASSTIRGVLDPELLLTDKSHFITDCLEYQFTFEFCILLRIYLILYDAVNRNKVSIH
jgi:hypothetical protein